MSLNKFQFLVSKEKRNNVKCAECDSAHEGAHLYCIKFEREKDNQIKYAGKYTVGCTHAEWDGEDWCDGCYTIADDKILCSTCACLKWGTPVGNFGNRKYLWVDGSISCYKQCI